MPPEYTDPVGVGADHLDPPAGDLLEVAARAADRAAGADTGDEVGDLAVGLLPDLRSGGLVVAGRVVRVAVLVRLPAPSISRISRSETE